MSLVPGKIYEGRPEFKSDISLRCIRLVIHELPTEEDKKALSLFKQLGEAIKRTDPMYARFFVLWVVRLDVEELRHEFTPPFINIDAAVGIRAVTKYLQEEIDDLAKSAA